jgi:Membrane bound FAD containing D-sorbitol dehydrogenase
MMRPSGEYHLAGGGLPMTSAIARRDFLLASIAAAIAAAGGGFPASLYAESAIGADQFLALSQNLTQASSLDPGIAKTLLGGFLATGNGAALAELVADPGSGTGKNALLTNAIVGAWYSGVYNTAAGPAVATFDQALLWNALTYTKPFGECGGDTGYWSAAPKA